MEWFNVNETKPVSDQECFVININWFSYCYRALYYKKEDTFVLNENEIEMDVPLSVTHWLEVPYIY